MFIPQMICGEKEYQNQTNKCSRGIPKSYVGYKCLYLCPSHRRKSFHPINIELNEEALVAPECFHRRKAASSRRRSLKGLDVSEAHLCACAPLPQAGTSPRRLLSLSLALKAWLADSSIKHSICLTTARLHEPGLIQGVKKRKRQV